MLKVRGALSRRYMMHQATQHSHSGVGTNDIMLVSLELGEVTLLATMHHHICKVQAREAYLRWKVQFDAEVDSSTDAFQFFWGDVDFVIFLCSVIA